LSPDSRVRTSSLSSMHKAILVLRLIFTIPLICRFADYGRLISTQEAGSHFRIVSVGPLRSL
jgi:hypothetical protein